MFIEILCIPLEWFCHCGPAEKGGWFLLQEGVSGGGGGMEKAFPVAGEHKERGLR